MIVRLYCLLNNSLTVELRGEFFPFIGFFIQARTENNQDLTSSIVGVWTPLDNLARRATCNGVNGVSDHACTQSFDDTVFHLCIYQVLPSYKGNNEGIRPKFDIKGGRLD